MRGHPYSEMRSIKPLAIIRALSAVTATVRTEPTIVGPTDMTAYPELSANFRTLQRFDNGNPINPPLWFGETFPFGDPKNVLVLNSRKIVVAPPPQRHTPDMPSTKPERTGT
jgi:hypothetical protein